MPKVVFSSMSKQEKADYIYARGWRLIQCREGFTWYKVIDGHWVERDVHDAVRYELEHESLVQYSFWG